MSDLFHHPYHFVPMSSEQGPGTLEFQETPFGRTIKNRPAHLTHCSHAPQTIVDGASQKVSSGRMVCRLKVCESLAVGGRQKEADEKRQQPREVSLFKVGDRWAIPSSSLRGLLSSLAEAASNSALRVLANEPYKRSQGKGRGSKPLGLPFEYFQEHYPESVPLHFGDKRKSLSLAEQIFGVIESVPSAVRPPKGWKAFSMAGRVQFSNALASAGVTLCQPQITQIMDGPKPPSASMYMQPEGREGYVEKLAVNPTQHRPQGRKFYLHRPRLKDADWVSADPAEQSHQKALVAPLHGGEFWFHLDFDNLSELDLGLLVYSLIPAASYHHKLGMGKALGLGKIKIEVAGIFLVDRAARYGADGPESAPRYHSVWKSALEEWPAEYHLEKMASSAEMAASPVSRRDAYVSFVGKHHPALAEILKAIELLGDPAALTQPVHYPQPGRRRLRASGESPARDVDVTGAEMERNSYEWFVANDERGGQYLRPLTAENTQGYAAMPVLSRSVSSQPPFTPAPVAPPPPPASSLVGTIQDFVVTRLGDGVTAHFKSARGGKDGKLADPADFSRLAPGLEKNSIIRLRVEKIAYPLWLLSVP